MEPSENQIFLSSKSRVYPIKVRVIESRPAGFERPAEPFGESANATWPREA